MTGAVECLEQPARELGAGRPARLLAAPA